MIRNFAIAVLLIALASPCFGQKPLRVTVVSGASSTADDGTTNSVVSSIKARVGSTERYTIDADSYDLEMGVICVATVTDGQTIGHTCSSVVDYYPFASSKDFLVRGLQIPRDGHIVTSSQTDFIAQSLFESFVNNTQPSTLQQAKRTFVVAMQQLVLHPEDMAE